MVQECQRLFDLRHHGPKGEGLFLGGSFLNPLRKGNYNNKGADVWE